MKALSAARSAIRASAAFVASTGEISRSRIARAKATAFISAMSFIESSWGRLTTSNGRRR
jgi:hypothetical protein